MRTMFICGEQNASLTYLPALAEAGVDLARIPCSGHWPMYSHPVAMWTAMTQFYGTEAEA